jgi:hypothetical protein
LLNGAGLADPQLAHHRKGLLVAVGTGHIEIIVGQTA